MCVKHTLYEKREKVESANTITIKKELVAAGGESTPKKESPVFDRPRFFFGIKSALLYQQSPSHKVGSVLKMVGDLQTNFFFSCCCCLSISFEQEWKVRLYLKKKVRCKDEPMNLLVMLFGGV